MKVKLTTVYGDVPVSVFGDAPKVPQVGESFVMIAKPTDGKLMRYIKTTAVTEADVLENIVTFYTESGSVYTLEVL